MSDYVKEAREFLAKIADRDWYIDGAGTVLVDDQPIEANGNDPDVAAFVGAAPRLIEALIDECERHRARNCDLCHGTGTRWAGEDQDRPVWCSACFGSGKRPGA